MVVTNTIPLTEEAKATLTKVKVLSIAGMLARLITAVSNHESLSKALDQ